MDLDDLRDMPRHQVRRHEERLRARARAISDQVEVATADGLGRPWTSRETGLDMSFEFEHWRRWAWLVKEMERSRADVVADLGETRLAYWEAALDSDALQPPPPLSSFEPVEPLMRLAETRARREFRAPPRRTS